MVLSIVLNQKHLWLEASMAKTRSIESTRVPGGSISSGVGGTIT